MTTENRAKLSLIVNNDIEYHTNLQETSLLRTLALHEFNFFPLYVTESAKMTLWKDAVQ